MMKMKVQVWLNGETDKYLLVSDEMIGKEIEIKIGYVNTNYRFSKIAFVDSNGEIIEQSDDIDKGQLKMKIPENTAKLVHMGQTNGMVYEIIISNEPIIKVINPI